MPIAPIINAGVTPQARRPRPTISETTAVAGPFSLELYCTESGKYGPSPNDVFVGSGRIAVTPTQTPTTEVLEAAWGADYSYAGDISESGTVVGYLWFKSIDANSDGYDDLESSGVVTISNAIATDSTRVTDNPLGEFISGTGYLSFDGSGSLSAINLISGTGAISFGGSGHMSGTNPIAGVGELTLTGSGYLGTKQFIAGIGTMSFSGSGALTEKNPISGAGSLSLSSSGKMSATNRISGTGTLTLTGSGQMTVAGSGATGTQYLRSDGTYSTSAPTSGAIDITDLDANVVTVAVKIGSQAFSTAQSIGYTFGPEAHSFQNIQTSSSATSITVRFIQNSVNHDVIFSGATIASGKYVDFNLIVEHWYDEDGDVSGASVYCGADYATYGQSTFTVSDTA